MTASLRPGLPEKIISKISHGLGEDWHTFGLQIGFSGTELQNLQASFPASGRCCAVARMLDKWAQVVVPVWQQGKSLVYLRQVLLSIERQDILEELDISPTREDHEHLQLDAALRDALTDTCLCYTWSANIDAQLLSRIQRWQGDCKVFYESRAYKHIRRLMDEKGIVIITGKQGDGKSSIAERLILHYLCRGFELAIVNSPKEWRERWNPKVKQIIFIDDVFGKTQAFPSLDLQQWVVLSRSMTQCIEVGVTKVVSTVRDYIHRDCQAIVRDVEIFRNVMNISSDEWKLNSEEKYGMLQCHLDHYGLKMDEGHLKEIAEKQYIQGFPLRCRLFFSDERLQTQSRRFFLGPLADVLVDELHYLEQTDRLKYSALALLMLCGGTIPEELFSPKNQNTRVRFSRFMGWKVPEPIDRVIAMLRSELGFTDVLGYSKLHESLDSLTGTYVLKTGTTFRFVHETVAEAMASTFGNSPRHQHQFLTHCSSLDLQQRVHLTSCDWRFHSGISPVTVETACYSALAERLTHEIEIGRASDFVYDSRFFRNGFPEFWQNYLSGLSLKKLKNILDLRDKRGHNFTYFIARQGNIPLLKLVLRVNPQPGHLMLLAASTGKTDAVKMLLDEGANVNQQNSHGQTALLLSTVEGHISLANLLLEQGADINLTDIHGCCPLQSSSAHGQLSLVEKLLQKGAQINSHDATGCTALFHACLKGHKEIVQLLLENQADISIANSLGGQPLLASCVNGHMGVTTLLLDKDPDLDHKEYRGRTALHWATEKGFQDIVAILLEKGANISITDDNWQTPLHLAALKGHNDIWRMLVSAGADMYVTDRAGSTPVGLANKESKIPALFQQSI